jgi:hypothetical protein
MSRVSEASGVDFVRPRAASNSLGRILV